MHLISNTYSSSSCKFTAFHKILSIPPLPQSLVKTIFPSVPMRLALLDSTYKWLSRNIYLWHLSKHEALRATQVVANGRIFSSSWLNISLCVYRYHIFLIPLAINGLLGYFHTLAILNNAYVNIGVKISFQCLFSFPLDVTQKWNCWTWTLKWIKKNIRGELNLIRGINYFFFFEISS